MRVFYEGGIRLMDGLRTVILDPERKTPDSVVSHGHLDHLTSGGIMTPETLDILRTRRGSGDGVALSYGQERAVNGLPVSLRDAGHVFGSAMVRVDDVLYTGDFNPEGGATCGRAVPEEARTLIIDATYGKPNLKFAPKREIEADLLTWLEMELARGPVALGGYEFGKSQELIALVNRLGVEVAVTDRIADLADVCVRHGVRLHYRRISELAESERRDPRVYVLPSGWMRPPLEESVSWLGTVGLRTAYVSGWAAFFDFTRRHGLDAQFPLSDHADFDDLMEFIQACRPRRVYPVFTYAPDLAKAVERTLRIPAEPLHRR